MQRSDKDLHFSEQIVEPSGLDSITPCVHWAQYFQWPADQPIVNRRIYDYEFLYMHQGLAAISLGDKSFEMRAGDLLYIPSGVPHGIAVQTEIAVLTGIHFDYYQDVPVVTDQDIVVQEGKEQLHRYGKEPQLGQQSFLFPTLIRNFRGEEEIRVIVEAFTEKRPYYELLVRGMLLQLLSRLLRERENHASRTYVSIRYQDEVIQLAEAVRSHCAEDWSNVRMARSLNVHEDYMARLFLGVTGMTPRQFVRHARHMEAKRLLRETDLTVDAIASKVGYAHTPHFTRTFRKLEQQTPREYRGWTRIL
ncbi:HTH-type transcriptional activator RhaS [compost metagenome]